MKIIIVTASINLVIIYNCARKRNYTDENVILLIRLAYTVV